MAEEWDVFQLQPDGDLYDNAPVYLATLYEAREKTIRVERDGPGSGQFSINRTSPECQEAILAQGNLVKVRIPEIDPDYIFAFFLETGDFSLISSQEAGGEMLTFGGRGILSYLEYARAWNESYIAGGQDPIAGVWRAYAAGTGAAPGQILRRLLEEFQDPDRPQQPLPYLTIDFDYDDDSTADPWDETDATDEFSYQVGEDGLAILLRLLETNTIRVQMDPAFLLSAYNVDNFGRDLTGASFGAGVVRFERGVNIATELRRELVETRVATHILVQGEADKYGTAALSDAASRVTKEAFLAAFGTGTTALNGIGAVDLAERLRVSDTIAFPIANRRTDVDLQTPVTVGSVLATPGLATAGYYLPGPEGTLGDFWVGDTVRVHTGSGPFDYDEVDAVVQAITITREDDNKELVIIPELKTEPVVVTIEPYSILYSTESGAITSADAIPIYFDSSGDRPDSGFLPDPTIGPITQIPGPDYPGVGTFEWAGFIIGGTGTIDVTLSSSVAGVPIIGDEVTMAITKNGVVVGPDTIGPAVSNFTWAPGSPDVSISITGLAVVPGDEIRATLQSPGGRNFSVPQFGTSQDNFIITGGSLTV